VLIIHGTKDAVIGQWHGERLYQLANTPKERFWVEGADHNDLDLVAGKRYTEAIRNFAASIPAAAASAGSR